MSAPASMINCLKARSGVAARELTVIGERVGAHRVRVRVVGGVVVDLIADLAGQEVLAAPRLGDVLRQLTAARRRVHVGVDAPHSDSLGGGLALRDCHGHRGLP